MGWLKAAQTSAWGQNTSRGAPAIYSALRERANPHSSSPELNKKWKEEIVKIPGYDSRKSSSSWAYVDYDYQKRKNTDMMNPLNHKGMEWKLYFTVSPRDGSEKSMENTLEALKDLPRQLEANLGPHGIALLYKVPGTWSGFLRENDTVVMYHPFEPRSGWTDFISSVVRRWMVKWGLEEGKRSYNEGFDWQEQTEYKGGKKMKHEEVTKRLGWLRNDEFMGFGNDSGGGSFGVTLAHFMELVGKNPDDPRWKGLVKGGNISMKDAADWLIGHGKEVAQELM